MKGHDAEVWATDCPLAALQFQQHAGVRPMHPMTLLARAYRADGFRTQLGREPETAQSETGTEIESESASDSLPEEEDTP